VSMGEKMMIING